MAGPSPVWPVGPCYGMARRAWPERMTPRGRDGEQEPSSLPLALEFRFRAAEQRLEHVEDELDALGGAEAAKRDIAELRRITRELEQGMTNVIRSSRADTLKYVAFTVGPAMLAAAGIVIALITGNVPGKP